MSAEKFEEFPIIFGDFMKVGASRSDRIYEELVNMKKVPLVLSEVSHTASLCMTEKDTCMCMCMLL